MLTDNPLIGQLTRHDLRELVIGQGAHGHIALYRYVVAWIPSWSWRSARNARQAMHAMHETGAGARADLVDAMLA
ncbi:type II toxin-antitoxin system RelE/ParE family toxin [Xanthomonas sp. CFBP 8445]|uniref:type II toxin-antitoxin system RelE/ParE family toxin n=1 Tax=Xanthomonas sp. CFBP 8445 TaxID=2971236 RepID=UPI0021E0F6AB|nr:type II toxin-antitoxin system RelE/ParE family toxin [Xanthomonas sp. CFBP 8445]UYC11424.1 type II toxin-antitoxin system RelE/ParE family toxin [Xanthomonas sp. CFBP 8445]